MKSASTELSHRPPVRTILLVEDEDAVRDVTQQVLENDGYQVLAAPGPEAAVRIANRFQGHIHLLLTDVVMPEMSGAELAVLLKASQPDLITVFMSGYTDNAVLRHALQQLGAWYIQKPFTLDGLLSRVAEALSFPIEVTGRSAAARLPV